MRIHTRNFGEIEFDETNQITFNEGIPGFRELKKYIIIEENDNPFVYLQSTEDGDIRFVMINPYEIKKDYVADIRDQYIEMLGGGDSSKFIIFVIATVPEDFEAATVNLMAPIIIQNETRLGMQVILEGTTYNTRHKIIDLLKEGGC